MNDNKIHYGCGIWAVPLTITADTVYVHTDIEQVLEVDKMTGEIPEDLWQYHEVQYTLEEYEELMKSSKAGD